MRIEQAAAYDTGTLNLSETVTVEVIATPRSHQESVIITPEAARNMIANLGKATKPTHDEHDYAVEKIDAGVHFLSDDTNADETTTTNDSYERKKNEQYEYIMQNDGTVVCKLCGEVLQSRTHWYRHKYKVHVNNLINPAPLFKCKHCCVFFKSRKGYLGHLAARHSTSEEMRQSADESATPQSTDKESDQQLQYDADEELSTMHKCRLEQDHLSDKAPPAWEEQRIKEEKLVAAIIARVRKECEAQGSAVSRRGYTRRSTVMMNST